MDVACSKLTKIGIDCKIVPMNIRIEDTPEFYDGIDKLNFDVAMDCLDNYTSRFAFEKIVNGGNIS